MRAIPSKAGVAKKLKSDGFEPAGIEVMLDELFRIRKAVVVQKHQNSEDAMKELVRILDRNDPQSNVDAEALHSAACDLAPRLARDSSAGTATIISGVVVLAFMIVTLLFAPGLLIAFAAILIRIRLLFFAFLSALASYLYWFTASIKQRLRERRRMKVLRQFVMMNGYSDVRL